MSIDQCLPQRALASAQRLAGIVHGDGNPADVAQLLTPMSVRELHEVAVTLAAMVDIDKTPAELLAWCDDTDEALPWTGQGAGRRIIETVADFYTFEPADLTGQSKAVDLTRARQIAMWLCVTRIPLNCTVTALMFNRHHTTVMHARDRIEQALTTDPRLRRDIDQLIRQISAEQASPPTYLRVIEGASA